MNERWIDAFNVMHRLPQIRQLLDDDLQEAIDAFLRLIAPRALRTKDKWILVFDGPVSNRSRAPGPVDCVFAPNADAWIMGRLRSHSNPAMVLVVSSDEKDIGRPARELGAKVQSADDFIAILKRGQRKPEQSEKPGYPQAEELDYWLEVFSDGEEDEPSADQ